MKILTTAAFSVVLLKKSLTRTQWLSMVLLFIGVAIVQVQVQGGGHSSKSSANVQQYPLVGFAAVLTACVASGFSGVYFEMILKGSTASLWLRNIQLGLFGILAGLLVVVFKDGVEVNEKGFFFAYSPLVWTIIFIQAGGGLLIAIVVKYADNILKGFATSISIIVSTIVSIYIFNFVVSAMFVVGVAFVILAIYLYSLPKKTVTGAADGKNSPQQKLHTAQHS